MRASEPASGTRRSNNSSSSQDSPSDVPCASTRGTRIAPAWPDARGRPLPRQGASAPRRQALQKCAFGHHPEGTAALRHLVPGQAFGLAAQRGAEFLPVVERAEGLEVGLAAAQRLEAELERHVAGDDASAGAQGTRPRGAARASSASFAAPRIGSAADPVEPVVDLLERGEIPQAAPPRSSGRRPACPGCCRPSRPSARGNPPSAPGARRTGPRCRRRRSAARRHSPSSGRRRARAARGPCRASRAPSDGPRRAGARRSCR